MRKELYKQVRAEVGPFAAPDMIIPSPELPMTRSGKIMRRILRKIAAGETSSEQLGDISTLGNPHVVENLIKKVKADMETGEDAGKQSVPAVLAEVNKIAAEC